MLHDLQNYYLSHLRFPPDHSSPIWPHIAPAPEILHNRTKTPQRALQILPKPTNTVSMAQMTPAEMEEFQNLSDRYQADLPGPLIGEKLPMDVLVTEYAQADPTYVVKTTGLAATHGAYRAVKGDGQCGWRATVFGYFESLLNSGDAMYVQTEKLRLQTFADQMRMIGLDYDLLSDIFDSTWELLDRILQAVERGDRNPQVILDTMNDHIASDSVVYHFKMMTSTHMQLRADQYEPFMEMTVDEYRVSRIDPTNQEIDQIGLQALTDAIVSPAGIALEVLYLDRSMGEEVTPHQFSQVTDSPYSIRLLYRPGHYDIVYKEDRPVQVYLQSQMPQNHMIAAQHPSERSDAMQAIFGGGPMPLGPGIYNASYDSAGSYLQHGQYEDFGQFTPQPSVNYCAPHIYQSMPQSAPPPVSTMPISTPSQQPPPHPQPSATHSNSSRSVTLSPAPSSATASPNEPQIRFTSTMYNMHRHASVPLVQGPTSFSSSVNHFQHHNFDPHQYNPQNDYHT